MIISHKYKYIFIKTRKTAGTSIEIALSKFCGPDDIITPIMPEDEEIRMKLGYRGPQNYSIPYSQYSLKDWKNRVLKNKKLQFYNHIPAALIQKWIDPEVWHSYYKFCFERNPWDKAISLYYYYMASNPSKISLNEYIQQAGKWHLSNFDIYTINGQVAVNHVALYENLGEELDCLAQRLGLPPGELVLPNAKGNFREDRRPYQEVVDKKSQQIIQDFCCKEIELLNYKFKSC